MAELCGQASRAIDVMDVGELDSIVPIPRGYLLGVRQLTFDGAGVVLLDRDGGFAATTRALSLGIGGRGVELATGTAGVGATWSEHPDIALQRIDFDGMPAPTALALPRRNGAALTHATVAATLGGFSVTGIVDEAGTQHTVRIEVPDGMGAQQPIDVVTGMSPQFAAARGVAATDRHVVAIPMGNAGPGFVRVVSRCP